MFAAKNLLLTSKTGPAVITYDATGVGAATTTQTTSTPITGSWTHTVASGAAVVLAITVENYVGGGYSNFTRTATCGGVAMTSLGVVNGGNDAYGWIELFGLLNVTGGAQTLAYSITNPSGVTFRARAANSVSYTGVSSFGTAVTNTGVGSGTISTGSVTSATNKMVVAAFGNEYDGGGTINYSAFSGTQRYYVGQLATSLMLGDTAGASSVTFTVSLDYPSDWGSVAVPLN